MAETKTVKMYTTKAGAKQYGSREKISKHADKAFYRFIANPTTKTLEALDRFEATYWAASAKEFRDRDGTEKSNVYDKLEKSNLSAANKAKARSLLNLRKQK